MHSSYFADSSVFYIFGDLQDGFSFIIQFGTDMTPGIVISFIQVEYRMDVKLVIAWPSHQLINNIKWLAWTVDVMD